MISLNIFCIDVSNLEATGQDFGIRSVLVSGFSLSCKDRSCVSRLWSNASQQSVWRAKEEERIDHNVILELVNWLLVERSGRTCRLNSQLKSVISSCKSDCKQ